MVNIFLKESKETNKKNSSIRKDDQSRLIGVMISKRNARERIN
jgi:hypothetical protein